MKIRETFFLRFSKAFIAIGVLFWFVTGCSDNDSVAINHNLPPLRVACEATFPPYAYQTFSGEIDGIEITIMRIVARSLGRNLEIKNTTFENLFPLISSKQVDLAGSGIAITEERKTRMIFSKPYITGAQVLLVPRTDNTTRKLQELKGKRVGVEAGTTGEDAVKDAECIAVSYSSTLAAVSALQKGQIDAVVIDQRPAEYFTHNSNALRICKTPVLVEQYAFAFEKNNVLLCAQTNAILKAMNDSGILQRIIARYEATHVTAMGSPNSQRTVSFDIEATVTRLMENSDLKKTLEYLESSIH